MNVHNEITNNIDRLYLKIDLTNIEEWVKMKGLYFNENKCKTIIFYQ